MSDAKRLSPFPRDVLCKQMRAQAERLRRDLASIPAIHAARALDCAADALEQAERELFDLHALLDDAERRLVAARRERVNCGSTNET